MFVLYSYSARARCDFLIKIITQFRQLTLDYIFSSQLILMKSDEEIGRENKTKIMSAMSLP